jgi:hypothetical protein
MSGKKQWTLSNTLFVRIIIQQHCAEVYTIPASGMTHSKFISNKINVHFRFISRIKNTDKNVLYCVLYLYRVQKKPNGTVHTKLQQTMKLMYF